MKRTFVATFAVLGIALFAALVYAVLFAAHVAEPVATTVDGVTARRLWATAAVVLGLAGLVAGRLALSRPVKLRVIVALAAGLTAAFNGGLNLAVANGGPGSGNGVVGGAAAFVLGLTALMLGGLGLARSRRRALAPER
jgi:hypothetical protein